MRVSHQVIDQHVIGTGAAASIEKRIVAALNVLHLDIDKQIEVFFCKTFSRLGHNLLNCLDVTHDASNHKSCQLLDSDLSCFKVSDQHALV